MTWLLYCAGAATDPTLHYNKAGRSKKDIRTLPSCRWNFGPNYEHTKISPCHAEHHKCHQQHSSTNDCRRLQQLRLVWHLQITGHHHQRTLLLLRDATSHGPVSVRQSQVGVLLKRLNESSWFLPCELPSTRPTLC